MHKQHVPVDYIDYSLCLILFPNGNGFLRLYKRPLGALTPIVALPPSKLASNFIYYNFTNSSLVTIRCTDTVRSGTTNVQI